MSGSATLADKESVLREMPSHPAVAAITAVLPEALADAKWDRSEMTLTIAPEHIVRAGQIVQQAGYNFLEDVTAVDWFPSEPRFQVSYHIVSHKLKERIRLRVLLEEEMPVVDTITGVWPSADYYEREVFDLFGIRFGGHPNMRRIMMPDDWEGHPLRKDYPVEGYR
ncbi:NADH-quinone oxidoreductase subunit C [Acidicapsa dinghuensis]|uniref:NADH-quinone oxidoreductase subunit C n=1 Tax=Acidicapsa dinghuensis TaxID=2218256 RepID=A0ABW1ELP5_9BACT|nr:NADH-quinone oxidoreductase subunit C [Acidicapsa dinghuensis]